MSNFNSNMFNLIGSFDWTATKPPNPVQGSAFWNTETDTMFVYVGDKWVEVLSEEDKKRRRIEKINKALDE